MEEQASQNSKDLPRLQGFRSSRVQSESVGTGESVTAPDQQDAKPRNKNKNNAKQIARGKGKRGGAKGVALMPPPAGPARIRKRHRIVQYSFVAIVVIPLFITISYLFFIAKDQYASHLGFFVRAEDAPSPVEILGGLTSIGGSSSGSDTDVLFEFIQSERIVRLVDERMNLRVIYNYPSDPVFSVDPDASIEELRKYWARVVKVFYDSGSGLIEVRVTAFDRHHAKQIADAIYDESSKMINQLTAIAREDATLFARTELEVAKDRLLQARTAIQRFRLETQILDPQADLVGKMGLLNSLQNQLASAQIDLDLIAQTAREGDPRLTQAERRVTVVEARLKTERDRFSSGDGTIDGTYANLIGEYEALLVEKEFAEKSYVASLAGLDNAIADAKRKSRYLAAYIEPTLAESAEYPRKAMFLMTLGAFLAGFWIISVMVYYSVRDRR